MTPERLAEIRARVEAATPGPWQWVNWANDIPEHPADWLVSPPETRPHGPSEWFPDLQNLLIHAPTDADAELTLADRSFVAHAREDVPALLAYIAELEDQLGYRK